MKMFEISERRACRVAGQARSTQRYQATEADEFEKRLTDRILEMKRTEELRRAGYRKITQHLVREGWKVNEKRIHRIWKELGLQVPPQQKKRRGVGISKNACNKLKPEYPNHCWSYDFKHDVTENGKQLKFLVVIDEFTRRCLEIRVGRSCKAEDVIRTLTKLFRLHGLPTYIRSDNGPEFIAESLRKWLEEVGVKTAFVEPGSPWQNGYCESFVAQLTNELINGTLFTSLLETRVLAEDYQHYYNTERLHGALDYQPPAEFYQRWLDDQTSVDEVA